MARRDKVQKTNAMRELERAGVAFKALEYETDDESPASGYGLHVAELLGEDPDAAFKTLVTVTPSGGHVVCCIPVAEELDLKKAAVTAGEKSLTMMHVRDLEPTTGYVRGGCSPIGMKRAFPTIIDETAQLFGEVSISGGRRGLSLVLSLDDLVAFTGATLADITREG
ncbi:MAG: Cys-tRNA(Pro) deacylase [Atopobiaceae bacterium]|nr:Cys-tRNA(Pro) deacylase [Atopobiaceae bacterium]